MLTCIAIEDIQHATVHVLAQSRSQLAAGARARVSPSPSPCLLLAVGLPGNLPLKPSKSLEQLCEYTIHAVSANRLYGFEQFILQRACRCGGVRIASQRITLVAWKRSVGGFLRPRPWAVVTWRMKGRRTPTDYGFPMCSCAASKSRSLAKTISSPPVTSHRCRTIPC
jgi:hypothetical protein